MRASPESGGELTTGIRYPTSSLAQWDGWTAPARACIAEAGEHLDIHTFVEAYLEKVLVFHQWLDAELLQVHAADLAQLEEMQEAYARLSADAALRPNEPAENPHGGDNTSELAKSDASQIDAVGRDILSKIRRLDFAPRLTDAFPSERPISAIITNDKILGTPVAWSDDRDGRAVVAFIRTGAEIFGLDADVYDELEPLADKILELSWARHALSRKFIEKAVLDWCRSSFRAEPKVGLSDAICAAHREQVKSLDVWLPIAHLEVEETFEFGPVKIAPITADMMNDLEEKGISSSPSQRDDIGAMFKDLRSRMQGYAAVVVHMEAEPTRAREDGMAIAQNAVGLLRFFSPTAQESWRATPTALLGSEVAPHEQALVLGEDHFSFTDGLISSLFPWRLSKGDVSLLRDAGLEEASTLVLPDGLNDFSSFVRAGLLLYSTGTTLRSHADRLIYTLASVEGILIKHSVEATEFNVEERMALLLAKEKQTGQVVARNVREAYRLRKRHGASILTTHDESSLAMFTHNAYLVLVIALKNLSRFDTRVNFIDAIDGRKVTVPTQQ